MNYLHRKLCSSARRKQVVQNHAIPWAVEEIDLGREVLEIRPPVSTIMPLCRRGARNEL